MKRCVLATILLLGFAGRLFPQAMVNASSSITCLSSFGTANFSITAGISPYSFTVQTPSCSSSFTSSTSSSNPSFALSCAGVYTFTILDATSSNLGTFTHSVVLNTSAPTVTASPTITRPCDYNTVGLNPGVSPLVAYSYSWTAPPSCTVLGSNSYGPGAHGLGTYSVTITDTNNGCSATNTVSVIQSSLTSQQIFLQRDTFCIGYQVLMTWSGTFGDFSLNSFIWNDGITALSRTETPTVTTAYSYTAVLTVIANTQTCAVQGYTTAIVKGCAAGIESYNKSPVHISVYPNPASTVLQIESENEYLDNSQIEIANVIGQTILSLPFSNMLNISTLSQGVYMLKITGQQSQVYYSKFVKE